MKSKLIYPMVVLMGFGVACGGRDSVKSAAAQQQYETVQEGSAAGVTSTIHGPGETLPPITGTNQDTTTAFTLNPAAVPPGTAPQQPTQAGAVPPPMMSSASPIYTPSYTPEPRHAASSPTPQPIRQPRPPQQSQQPQQAQQTQQPEQPQPAEPQPTEPAQPTGPATDTSTPQPAQEKPKADEPPAPPADDSSDEEAEEEPPPPPPPA